MKNNKVEEIMKLDQKIGEIIFKVTSYSSPHEIKELNQYDKKTIEYYQQILELIIEIAKEEKTKKMEVIDKKYFDIVNTASMMLESYIATLQFYRNENKTVIKKEIEVIQQIQENLILKDELEISNKIELADCYFHMGDEEKARESILNFIKSNPDEDEAYMCMQNWYMYDKPDINKLAEVIDLAEKNKHILFTDFGYSELVKFYEKIGDSINKQKYQKLYDKWKANAH